MFKNTKKALSWLLVVFMILPIFATSVIALEPMTNLTDIDMNDGSIKKVYFKTETNKDFTSYAVNEEITFKVTLWADMDGDGNTANDVQITTSYVQYSLEFDDGTESKVDYAPMTAGVATIKARLTKAGAVRLKLYACDASRAQIRHSKLKAPYIGGAIAGASEIQVTTPEPSDFDAFWKGELVKLDAVAPEIEYIADVSDKLNKPGFKCYEIRVKCAEANVKTLSDTSYVSMLLAMPETANPKSLQLDVTFSGYGVYDPVPTNPWSSGKNAVLMVYAHSLPLDKESGWYVNHFQESYPEYLHSTTKHNGYGWDYENDIEDNNNPEKVYFRDMFLRDLQAIRFFKKALGEGVTNTVNDIDTSAWKDLWNGKILQVSGSSQGGLRTIAAGALDSLSEDNSVGITILRAGVPWFADIADSTATGNIKSDYHPEYKPGLAYFDTALLAKRIEGSTVTIGAGTGDGKCPMAGVQAIYNNLKVNATLNFIQGKGHDASYSDTLGASDSSQSKISAEVSTGTITDSGPSDWTFDPATGILTISNELTSGWVRLTPCTAAGAWGIKIRDYVRHVVVTGRFSKIDPGAFDSYPLLETITLPQMSVQFDNNAFSNCPKLTEIKIAGDAYIPGTVDFSRQGSSTTDGHPVNTLADKNVFSGSKSIKTLILNNFYKDEEWYRLNKDALPVNLETIMGPADSEYLRDFCAANGYTFVPYGKATEKNAAWTYDESTKTVTIWGEGAIDSISVSDAKFLASAENLVINATITELGANTFASLTGLKSVTIKGNAPTVPANAKPFGNQNVTISVYKNAIGFGKTWCGYTVSNIIFAPGDVNCDETINAIDAVLLAQYLANWDVKIDDYSADCNGDGKINAVDAVLLAQYLAGWDVTLGGDAPPSTSDPDIGGDNEVEADDFFRLTAVSDYVIAGTLYNGDDAERLADFAAKIEQATGGVLPIIDNENLSDYEGKYIFLDDTNPDFSSCEIKVENGNIILYANYYSLDDCIKSFFSDMLGYDLDSGKSIGEVNLTQGKVYTVEKSAVYTKEKLMSVLEEIYNDDSRLIIGQQMNQTVPIGEVFEREVEAFREGCGVEAALYGWDCVGTMIYPENQKNLESGRVKIAYQMVEYMREGGIITLSAHFPNPAEENPAPGASIKHLFPNGDSDWQDLFTEGTDTYNRYWAYVEQLGDFLEILDRNGAPVIFRPFLEMNGAWCWYSMAYQAGDGSWQQYSAEYIRKLWIDLYNYLKTDRGIDNLIWLYSPNMANRVFDDKNTTCPVMYCYPGDEYVDIVGVDWYPGESGQKNPEKMLYAYEDMITPTGKIFVYGELSAGENRTVGDNYTFTATDYANMLKLYAESGIKSAYTLTWSSWDTADGRVKLTLYEMGNGKEFYANNPGFLDKKATKKLLYS